jgi:hypothetical protein
VLQQVADDVRAAGFDGVKQRRLPLLAGHGVSAPMRPVKLVTSSMRAFRRRPLAALACPPRSL